MDKEIFILSGLGADERVFQKLDLPQHKHTFVRWIRPIKNESMSDYARRLLVQVSAEKPILVGLSFGGMMAIEMAKIIDTEKIILISSVKTKFELPFYYRWAGALRLYKIIPKSLYQKANAIMYWFFGTHNIFEKTMLKNIMAESDPEFVTWAVANVLRWKNTDFPKNLMHIHGQNDHVLPHLFVKPNISISQGGHLMILHQAEELNAHLKKLL